MAVVLSHVHFCTACNDFWTCCEWLCAHDDCDELFCRPCDQRKAPAEVVGRGCVSNERAERGVEQHPSISGETNRAVPVPLREHEITFKELQVVGLTAGRLD